MRFLVRNFGSCLKFDGASTFGAFPDPAMGTNSTISLWTKTTPSIMKTAMGFFDTNPSAVGAVRIYTDTSGNMLYDIGGGETSQYPIGSIPNFLNRWSQLVLTLTSGTTLSLYCNSVLLNTHNDSKTGTSTKFELGRYNGGNYFKGLLDEVVVDSTNAWTQTQVNNAYWKGIYPSKALWLKLDDGSGSVVVDSSGNARNGTITGVAWSSDVFIKNRTAATP